MKKQFFGPLALALLTACAPTATRPATATYTEELRAFRPRYAVTTAPTATPPTKSAPVAEDKRPSLSEQPLHVNRRLELVLDTLDRRNRAARHVQGFRIQLYVGTSRQEAEAAKIFVYQAFPELNVYLTYSAPTYRLRTGDFVTRLDVERYHNALKDQYPAAMVLADKVEIRKSLLIK